MKSGEQVIRDEMNNLSSDFKAKNPEKAILRAAIAAGVAKKREAPVEYFSAGGMTPSQIVKAKKTEDDKFNESMQRGKDQAATPFYDSIMGKI